MQLLYRALRYILIFLLFNIVAFIFEYFLYNTLSLLNPILFLALNHHMWLIRVVPRSQPTTSQLDMAVRSPLNVPEVLAAAANYHTNIIDFLVFRNIYYPHFHILHVILLEPGNPTATPSQCSMARHRCPSYVHWLSSDPFYSHSLLLTAALFF